MPIIQELDFRNPSPKSSYAYRFNSDSTCDKLSSMSNESKRQLYAVHQNRGVGNRFQKAEQHTARWNVLDRRLYQVHWKEEMNHEALLHQRFL